MISDELENELNKLRTNADSLAECLGSLLKRIDELEEIAANKTSVNTTSSSLSDNILNSKTAKLLCKVAASINNNNNNVYSDLKFKEENDTPVIYIFLTIVIY